MKIGLANDEWATPGNDHKGSAKKKKLLRGEGNANFTDEGQVRVRGKIAGRPSTDWITR